MLIDIIATVILALLFFIGLRRGFVRIAFGVSSFVVAIILAWSISPFITSYLAETAMANEIENRVYEHMLQKEIKSNEKADTISEQTDKEKGVKAVKDYAEAEIRLAAAKKTSDLILSLISMIAVVIVTKLLMILLSRLLDAAASLPIIRGLNRLLGGLAGLILGIFVLEVLLAVLKLAEMSESGQRLIVLLEPSVFVRYLFENNYILDTLA